MTQAELSVEQREALDSTKIALRHQRPAVLPVVCTLLNRTPTRLLVSELRESSPLQRLNFAISTYERLTEVSGSSADQWSLNLLRAIRKGPKETRKYLIDEGVFNGGEYLYRPEALVPGMEIPNFNLESMPPSVRTDAEALQRMFFLEYMAMKNLLRKPTDGRVNRLNPHFSFLIVDHTLAVIEETRYLGALPLTAKAGPGAGEELIQLTSGGISVITYDILPARETEGMFRQTFKLSGYKCPEIINLRPNGKVDTRQLNLWESGQREPIIFICPETDLSKPGAIPEELRGRAPVADSIFALHEIRLADKATFVSNVASSSGGSVLITDGLPSPEALDRVVLPAGRVSGLPVTFSQAIITYLLCDPPEKVEQLVNESVPGLDWKMKIIPTPPPPFCYPLELTAQGRR